MNTQKAEITAILSVHCQVFAANYCAEINESEKRIYDLLKYKYVSFVRKKFVVRKSDFQKMQNAVFEKY